MAALEQQVEAQGSASASGRSIGVNPGQSEVDAQYRELSGRLGLLREQEKTLRSDIARLQDEILEIPLVEIELRRLTDQYNVYMEEFSEVRGKKYDAALAQSLEQEQKAERFVLLEPPQVPLEPKQDMLTLSAMAIVLSLGAGIAVAYLTELLDDRIYGSELLETLTGERPLVVIPYMGDQQLSIVGGSVARGGG